MNKYYFLFFAFSVCFSGINAQIYFQDTSSTIGLNFSTGSTYLGNGVSFCDADNDGWDDLTFATGAGLPVLFLKNVNGTFVNQPFNFTDPLYQTKQVNWVDYDNDGDKDMFVTSNTNRNILYNNDGSFNFQDVTASAGLPMTNLKSYGASWGDYNNDGFLDVFICNRDENFIEPNYLFKNNGDGTFTDVSAVAEIHNTSKLSFCAAFFDFNNDGWQDIYVSNDKPNNLNVLYKNKGDGTFSDVSQSSGTDIGIDAMTVTIDDFNSDGYLDIYVTNGPAGNVFLKNNGNETFTDIAASSGTKFNSLGWGAVFLDAENDTDLDLYVSGSLNGSIPSLLSAAFYKNQGNGTFVIPNNAGFANDNRESYSNAIGDFNNDGFLEIVVNNSNNQNLSFWHNQTVSNNKWLKVKLNGINSNKDGVGSVIEIAINSAKQYRYVLCGEGYLSQNSSTEVFGLGNNTQVDYVKVKWLSGIEDIIYNVNSNQLIEITEGNHPLSLSSNQQDLFEYYPNPVKNKLNFKSSEPITKITIFTILGHYLKTLNLSDTTNSIDLSDFTKGLYLIKVETQSQVKNLKIIKD